MHVLSAYSVIGETVFHISKRFVDGAPPNLSRREGWALKASR